jgi:chromatin remodeling complex protein RSC6
MARSSTKKQTEPIIETPSQQQPQPAVIEQVEKPLEKPVEKTKKATKKSTKETVPPVEVVVDIKQEPQEEIVVDIKQEQQEVGEFVSEQTVDFLTKIQQLCLLVSNLKSDFKQLEKKFQKDLKLAQKQSVKKKRKSGNRAPSGFVKPTRISDELAIFLNKPIGTEMARTSVTRDINEYIRTNSLQDKNNGRKILPDEKLGTLLKLTSTDELTYFNLQKYMSCHFAKNVKPVVVDEEVVAA